MQHIGILQGRLTASNGQGIQFFPTENWQREFELAHKIGFDCIELLVKRENPEENPLFSSAGITEIEKLKREFSIETPSVHGFYSKDENYSTVLSTLIENAAKVGGKTVLVSFFKDSTLKTEDDKSRARELLARPLKTAEKFGVRIGIEAEIPAAELKDFIKSFNSAALGVYYDIGNMVSLNVDVVSEIKLLGNLIVGIHVKDRERNGGETVPIGTGDADFKTILKTLSEIGYNGAYIMQGARKDAVDDVVLNKDYFQYIKNILNEIK